jgi:hypothetical protein
MYGGAALYVCKFMDKSGFGYASDALRCLNWCLQRNASISVNSWGANIGTATIQSYSDFASQQGVFQDMQNLLQTATVAHNHLFVTSAGNGGRQLAAQGGSSGYFFVPSQLQADSVLTVGATGARNCCCAGLLGCEQALAGACILGTSAALTACRETLLLACSIGRFSE